MASCAGARSALPACTVQRADGVHVGRADGWLYAVDTSLNVRKFDTGAGFLARGVMAVTSCNGLFVWRSAPFTQDIMDIIGHHEGPDPTDRYHPAPQGKAEAQLEAEVVRR
eukprot:CAMPEP_0171129184 /NCGR_PEP_ID=MMETSP0766_2-20121228/118453_1 /TAXON_ID=439317 /ORGANISM="Gambierdiscus australes, Strain CAWD 149" /LENGTH=110 /DNA_ID=CAMNT_0011592373 /DNA_START=144 /DNA_END=472 /DNA_ORIENTATION=+